MRKQKYIDINGKTFELCRTKNAIAFNRDKCDGIYNDLSDFYNRYSVYKERAWNDICTWCRQLPTCGIWIRGANCMRFTVCGFCAWNDVLFFVEFTGVHNRAYICNNVPCIAVKTGCGTTVLYNAGFEDAIKKTGWEYEKI